MLGFTTNLSTACQTTGRKKCSLELERTVTHVNEVIEFKERVEKVPSEKMTKTIRVTILNWEKHNPRRDIKKPTWFRLENKLVTDTRFYDLRPAAFKALIYILAQCSEINSPSIELSLIHASKVSRIKAQDLMSAISKMESIGMLRVDGENPNGSPTPHEHEKHATRRDETRRNGERDETKRKDKNKDFQKPLENFGQETAGQKQGPQRSEDPEVIRLNERLLAKRAELGIGGARG